MDPLDEYLEEKTAAGLGGFLKDVGTRAIKSLPTKELGHLGKQVGVVAGGVAAARAGEKAYYAATKKNDFNSMMSTNPQLKEYFDENPGRFLQHYTSFRTMNPRFSSEPTVAGTYMHQMSMNPVSAGGIIVESLGRTPPPTTGRDIQTGVGMLQKAEATKKKQKED